MLRRRGSAGTAQAYANYLVTRLSGGLTHRWPTVAKLASAAFTEAAILSEATGDLVEAADRFRQAYRNLPTSGFGPGEADVAVRLALSLAITGQPANARRWLGRADAAPAVKRLSRPVSHLRLLAEAFVGNDALERDLARRSLMKLGSALDGDDHWPYVLMARAGYLVVWGDEDGLTALLAQVRRRAGPLVNTATAVSFAFPGPLLAVLEARLLLALGRGNEAEDVLAGPYQAAPFLDGARALLALRTGADQRARDQAIAASNRSLQLPPMRRIELGLINAVASYRLHRRSEAIEALRRAVFESKSIGSLRPFVIVPRAELLAIAEDVPEARELLDDERLITAGPSERAAVRLVKLSRRETVILRELAAGRAAAEVAAALNVSVNTVRSQRRTLYRKLGVTSRTEAVRVAVDLGLVGDKL